MKVLSLLAVLVCTLSGCTTQENITGARPAASTLSHSERELGSTMSGQSQLFIYVGGEVWNPGRFAWTNGMTLADAIVAAGGFTDFAHTTLFISHSDGSREKLKINPKIPLIKNPILKPGDHVFSPVWFL